MFTDMMVRSEPPSSMRFALILFLAIHEIGSIWESHTTHPIGNTKAERSFFQWKTTKLNGC